MLGEAAFLQTDDVDFRLADVLARRRQAEEGAGVRAMMPLPDRHAIDPGEIVQHLPWIFMVDVLEGGADYRYRLLGTGIVAANYRDATGRSFRDLYGDDRTKLAGARLGFDQARVTAGPAFTSGRAFWRPDWAYDRFESAFLPLSTGGDSIDISGSASEITCHSNSGGTHAKLASSSPRASMALLCR